MRLLGYVEALENKSNRARRDEVLVALESLHIRHTLQQRRHPSITNIIVDFPGKPEGLRPIFSAHYDAVAGTPAANDNASGVAVLLGLCQKLSACEVPARVVFFDREEAWFRTPVLRLGLLGSLYYVYKAGARDISAVYNVDACGMGDYLGIWPVRKKESKLPAVRAVEGAATRLNIPFHSVHVPWYVASSDHLPFRLRGLPNSMTLSLIPRSEADAFLSFLRRPMRLLRKVNGRSKMPGPLRFLHTQQDAASRLNEGSLQLMLSLLLKLAGCS